MWRVRPFVLMALVALASFASPLAADQIVMRRGNFGADFAFIDSFLKRNWPNEYRPEEPLGDWPELTLANIDVGRHDVHGDGQVELFVHVGFVLECGTVGCPVYFFERSKGGWVEVDDVSGLMGGPSMEVWTDPETGFKNIISYYAGFRWNGEAYEYLGANEVVEVSARLPPDFETEGGCIEPRGDGFGYLQEYVGTKKSTCLLYDPNVKSGLDTLIGDEFLHLRKNLDFRPSIDYSEEHVYIEGSRRPTERGWEERAIVMVSAYDGRVHVGIYSEGTRTIYSGAKEWTYLPKLLRAWARGHLDPYGFEAPPDVVWIGRPGEEE